MQPQPSKNDRQKIDSLHAYAKYLGEANANLTEEIRKENLKTRQIIFTLATYFGLSDLTRQKITEQMREAGIQLLEEQFEQDKSQLKSKKMSERSIRRKYQDQILKLSEPKKKVKLNPPNIFQIEIVDRSKLKPKVPSAQVD